MKFIVSIYQDEDGMYGRTEAEAESNIAEAIRECLAVRAEHGMSFSWRDKRQSLVMTKAGAPATARSVPRYTRS